MLVVIHALNKIIVKKEIENISLPGPNGKILICKEHFPTVTLLSSGEIVMQNTRGEKTKMYITKGSAKIFSGTVSIYTNSDILLFE